LNKINFNNTPPTPQQQRAASIASQMFDKTTSDHNESSEFETGSWNSPVKKVYNMLNDIGKDGVTRVIKTILNSPDHVCPQEIKVNINNNQKYNKYI
jgi:hypothetical protein